MKARPPLLRPLPTASRNPASATAKTTPLNHDGIPHSFALVPAAAPAPAPVVPGAVAVAVAVAGASGAAAAAVVVVAVAVVAAVSSLVRKPDTSAAASSSDARPEPYAAAARGFSDASRPRMQSKPCRYGSAQMNLGDGGTCEDTPLRRHACRHTSISTPRRLRWST